MKATTVIERGCACVCLSGDFTIEYYRVFKAAIAELLDTDNLNEVSIDFNQVGFIDSAALGMLLLFRERLAGKSIRLVGVRGSVHAALDVANFSRLFAIESDRQKVTC